MSPFIVGKKQLIHGAAWAALACFQLSAAQVPAPPDLTRSNTVDRSLTYNLGATGLRGWIYTKAATLLDSQQGRTTTASPDRVARGQAAAGTGTGSGSAARNTQRRYDQNRNAVPSASPTTLAAMLSASGER